jgi:IS1 family transposase
MNKLPTTKRAQILQLLCEGMSMRATSRVADVSINTVTKLLVDAGRACSEYQDRVLRDLPCKRLQVDEIWAFCYAKQKNVPVEKRGLGIGDVWTWTAICDETKLIPSWFVGNRDLDHAEAFLMDLRGRLANRVQITTDGHRPYLEAVRDVFHDKVDHAMLTKIYGQPAAAPEAHRRYSPTPMIRAKREAIFGNPDMDKASTSYVERQNLTMRMSMRRFTRLTNGFSKKAENHVHAVSLHFMHYNFARIHKSLRITPAMAAGVSDHVWTMEEIAALVL